MRPAVTVRAEEDYHLNLVSILVEWRDQFGNQCGQVIRVPRENAPPMLPEPEPVLKKPEPVSYLKPVDKQWIARQLELTK